MTTFATLIDHGRIPALLSLGLAFLCVFGIILSEPLHITMLASQLATIAELSVPSGVVVSAAHSAIQAYEKKVNNQP